METVITPEVQADSITPKKIIERSASYPGISIEEAITFVTDIQKHFPGNRAFTRDDAIAVLKTKALNRDIAAAKEYGFLNKAKDGYLVSELFKTISNHLSEREKRKCLLEAFGSPKLYAEIIPKHDGHAIPNEFRTHLIRFHRIVAKVAGFAAEMFIQNGKYVGAINEHGILNFKEQLAKLENSNFQYAEVITDPDEVHDKLPSSEEFLKIDTDEEKNRNALVLNDLTEERVKVPLTNKKFAVIIYPSNITQTDINILKKQIEVLELLVT